MWREKKQTNKKKIPTMLWENQTRAEAPACTHTHERTHTNKQTRSGKSSPQTKLSKHSQTLWYVLTPTAVHIWVCMFTNKGKVGKLHVLAGINKHARTHKHAAASVARRRQQGGVEDGGGGCLLPAHRECVPWRVCAQREVGFHISSLFEIHGLPNNKRLCQTLFKE